MAATGSVLVLAAATVFLLQPLAAQLARDPTGIAADPTAEPVALLPRDPEMTGYISGSVRMTNGGSVPKETGVELVCGGFPRATDQVGPKGDFDIELSGRSLPFEPGGHGRAAVKIVDDRGVESLKIVELA